MATTAGPASAPPRRRLFQQWPQIFSGSRKPTDDSPWITSLCKLGTPYDGIKLFMQHYDNDRTSPEVDVVTDYCGDVCESDFNNQGKMNQGFAWLDDHPIPPVSEFAGAEVVLSKNVCSATAPDTSPSTQADFGLLAECDITDASERLPLVRTARVARNARYPERLTARDLRNHLREKRFDHDDLEDADRRLIYLANPSPSHILALTETAPEHQSPAVQELLWQYLEFQAAMNVRISTKGWRVFQLELHLPYLALRRIKPGDTLRRGRTGYVDLPFLSTGSGRDIWRVFEAQFSFTICGSDNNRWVAYGLEDTSFDPDRDIGEDERDPWRRSDQISMGNLDANVPFRDAREYFIAVCLIRITHVRQETQMIVRRLGKSFRDRMTSRTLSAASRTDQSTLEWLTSMLSLLSNLIQRITENTDCWARFKEKDLEYFSDPHLTLSPETNNHIQLTLRKLDDEVDKLIALEKKLQGIQKCCTELADCLIMQLSWHGGKNGEFTILIISPVVIVASIFAIPDQVLPYEQNTVSFAVSIATVMWFIWLLLLLRGGWLAQRRWWKRLLHGGKSARRGDRSDVPGEIGLRVLPRRRSTQAKLVRDT
jgi:hypothetical protein